MKAHSISEAFRALDAIDSIDESEFSLEPRGLEKLADFLHDDDIEVAPVEVIDDEAECECELQPSYDGKVILRCNVCGSNVFKEPQDVIKDDSGSGYVNIDEECPYCMSIDGFKVIGQVSTFDEESAETKDEIEIEDSETISESVQKIEIETENDKIEVETDSDSVKVETESKVDESVEEEETKEIIEPISDETQAEIDAENADESEDEIELEIEDVDEDTFDEVVEKFFRKNYSNVKGYKTESAKVINNSIIIEGIITFKTGNKKRTKFVAESYTAEVRKSKAKNESVKSDSVRRVNKVKFLLENKQLSHGKKCFRLSGRISDKAFVAESLSYNFKCKDEKGEQKRVFGTVKVVKEGCRSKKKVQEAVEDANITRDLTLIIENDGNIYRRFTTPAIDNLKKKVAKGVYDKELAKKLFVYVVENALTDKTFNREYDYSKGNVNVPTRKAVAAELLEYYEDQILEDSVSESYESNSDAIKLANKVIDFYKKFDYYDFLDSLNIDETDADAVDKLSVELQDSENVKKLLQSFDEMKSEIDEDDMLLKEFNSIYKALSEYQNTI